MELLERYLGQIKKHLPIKDREDTLEELRSLLLEELDSKSNGTNDEEILYEIIKNNGYPIEVAARYRNNEPLISSVVRPYFYMGIKIVSAIVPSAILIAKSVGFFNQNDPFTIIDFLLNIAYAIPSIINALIFAYGVVFIIFVLMNRYAIEEFKNEIPDFEPNNLPKIPMKVYKISIFEHIFEIFMTVLFLYLLNYNEGLISFKVDNVSVQLLNDNFSRILPLLNISLFLTLTVSIIQLSSRSRSKFSITLNYIQTIYSGIIMILLASNDIITDSIIVDYNLTTIPNILRVLLYIGAIAAFVGGTISYFITLNKMNGHKKSNL
jgi:hypothetical protein